MPDLLFLIPAIPFASAAILAVLGAKLPRRGVAVLACGSVAASAVVTTILAFHFPGHGYTQHLWTWFSVAGLQPEIGLYLDQLSLIMSLVVTYVGFFIHVYSTEYMAHDEGYSRFFAYMNLFVASMLTLLLASDLLLLFLGWEGVGLCSYLLIGFWYKDPVNGAAARKAFIVTRVGDTAFTLGLFILFHHLGTLQIQDLMQRAQANWPVNTGLAVAAAALLLGGAVGKSAQLPLQTWLPDAMAGPTPTSALIHAATMVTAGVYLIARTHVLYTLAPPVQFAVAVIGAATLLMAGVSALSQTDIKRVLAWSTISQIGYMFLALGVGAWSAAIFHFMTHAFFKALLFLTAGLVIEALHHEQNIFNMGGLRKELPIAFWSFLIGGSALAGLPLITSGYWSKDLIVWSAWSAAGGSSGFWVVGLAGVFLTSLYTYRLILVVFFGPLRTPVTHRPGLAMSIPVMILCALSIVGGYVRGPFINFLTQALPATAESTTALSETLSGLAAAAMFAAGALLAYKPPPLPAVGDWGFDWLYDRIFVRPILWFARINRGDFIDAIVHAVAAIAAALHGMLSHTETGRLRWYAAGIAFGSVLFVALVLLS